MAYTDIIQLGSTTHTYTGSNAPTIGATGNEIDGSWSTYYGLYLSGGTARWLQNAHTFDKAYTIDQVDYSFYGYAYEYGDDTGYVWLNYKLQWYNGSVWADISGSTYSDYHSQYHDSLSISVTTGHVTLTGLNLTNCRGILGYIYGRAYNNKNSNSNVRLYVYETQAWGQVYADIGLRYVKGSTTYNLGVESLSASHKLRVYDGATTYGIPFVETDNSQASPFRIYTGSGVKALPLAT